MNNIIETSLPLPAVTMVNFFKNRADTTFVIDYDASLKALRTHQAVLNYIANMKLKVVEVKNCTIEPELIYAFAGMRDACDVELFYKVLGNILYFCKYSQIVYEDVFDAFDFDKIVAYVQAYSDSIIKQTAFLNSIPLYTAVASTLVAGDKGSESDLVTTVDDKVHQEISRNLLGLFTVDHFLLRYLEHAVPLTDQIYFEPHFDRNMYQGQSMFHWFAVPQNSYFLLVKHVMDSLKKASTRLDLVDLYAHLAAGIGEFDKIEALNTAVAEAGGILKFVKATRKDIAEMNREARKAKKRAKAAA